MLAELVEGDRDIFLQESRRIRTCLSPRVIILDRSGNFPLVRYRDTEWQGLPGGKINRDESDNGNFLSAGAFPSLTREVQEECGIDISSCLEEQITCLGLAEIATVDDVKKQITVTHTPIFVCLIDTLGEVGDAQVVNITSHLPGPLFPDARLGIVRLREIIKLKEKIQPEQLHEKGIYFMLRPKMGLLMGPPHWMC